VQQGLNRHTSFGTPCHAGGCYRLAEHGKTEMRQTRDDHLTNTSPWRTFAGGVALRHRYRLLRAWWAANAAWLASVGFIFFLVRACFYGIAALAHLALPESSESAFVHHPWVHSIIEIQWRWDAVHYFAIARNGYGQEPGGLAAFFPLFPATVHLLGAALDSGTALIWDQSLLIAGPIVAAVASLAALLLVERLVALDDDALTTERAVLYLSIFPFSFYFIVPYAEAVLLLTSVGCFLALRRQRWLVAGICGCLAILSKQLGIVLIIPFAWELAVALRAHWQPQGRRGLVAQIVRGIAGLALLPLGLGLYMWYLGNLTGDPLTFAHTQRDWDREFILPPVALWEGLRAALIRDLNPVPVLWGSSILQAATAFGCIAVAIAMVRQVRASYSLYTIATLAIVFSTGMGEPRVLHTVGRQVIHLFPLFIVLARWGRWRQFNLAFVLGSAMLFALCVALYVQWYPVS
jgi:hypothetical protein